MVAPWLVGLTVAIFVYAVYEAVLWPIMDMTMEPKQRRPWTIRYRLRG